MARDLERTYACSPYGGKIDEIILPLLSIGPVAELTEGVLLSKEESNGFVAVLVVSSC